MSDTGFTRRGVIATSAAVGTAALVASQLTPETAAAATPSPTGDPSRPGQPTGPTPAAQLGAGGEVHQVANSGQTVLTTNQGVAIADGQNSLKLGQRGPVLLEDFILREKITHFDHERIPERVVHARGLAAHGYFELAQSLAQYTTADILSRTGERTPLFTRFSTVAGNKGSTDMARDVRGFAVKFYTKQGNWDIVGNTFPGFDSCREGRAGSGFSPGAVGSRYFLGLRLPHSRKHAHDHVDHV